MRTIKSDVIAGFNVFLLALPLCLGIAIASKFPPLAGILTAIVGGILASLLGGAQLSIKGPAAGLIVIVFGAVQQLGEGDLFLGYKYALAVGVVAALIQILIAITKKAIIAEIMPPFVIHGMLAAIGVIIISKQAYVMMGIDPSGSGPLALLFKLPLEMVHANPIILAIGLVTFFIIAIWPYLKKVSFIPSSVVILVTVIPLSIVLNLNSEHVYTFLGQTHTLNSTLFINLPTNFFHAVQFPDFSMIFSPMSLKYIILFALVGSIESILTVCAVNSMTSQHAPSDLNKDLCAVGIANLVCAFIGGLPMISEIVRSKANIDYGAQSAKSNFFHGVFMLIAVILFPTVLNFIPLSALAALLIFVGLKLASPREFIHAYEVGKDQLLLFLTTFITTLAVDLLVGIVAGIILKLILHRLRGHSFKSLFNPTITIKKLRDRAVVQVEGPLTFVSYLKLKKAILEATKITSKIVISFYAVTYIDHTVLKKILNLSKEIKNVEITIEENQQLVHFYDHPLSTRGKSQSTQR